MSRIHDALERSYRERQGPREWNEGARESRYPKQAAGKSSLAALASHFTQECDTLRSAIEVAFSGQTKKVIMFTSAVRHEGCTTMMGSLGYALASRAGVRVALVDANIRNPGLANLMSLGPHAGLTDVVGRELDPESALRSTAVPNLYVLLGGNTPLISSEVFGSPKTVSLLEWLKERHDYVLLDVPAVMPMPEVAVQSKDTDGVVLVVRANRTDRNLLQKARDILESSGANLLGVILNRRRYVIPEFIYGRL